MAFRTFTSAFALYLVLLAFNSFGQCDNRYQTEIFQNVTITSDIKYGEGYTTSFDGSPDFKELKLDIYQPTGDTYAARPLVILAHGGSFVGGAKTSADIVYMCNYLAKRGYVAVSIQYRLEGNLFSLYDPQAGTERMVKAVMRAVGDGKAAVRFFRKTVAEDGNPYKIDPDLIFFGGVSAGGILALHLAFMDDISTLPANWQTWANELGGLDAGNTWITGYPEKVNGILSHAGAIADTNWINRTTIPIISWHAEGDATVPYGKGQPMNIATLPPLYGSHDVHLRATNIGAYNEFFSYTGNAHPPLVAGQSVQDANNLEMKDFLYKFLPCNPDNLIQEDSTNTFVRPLAAAKGLETGIFPVPAQRDFTLQIQSAGNQTFEGLLTDLTGKVLTVLPLSSGANHITRQAEWKSGTYLLQIRQLPAGNPVKTEKLVFH